MRLLFRSVMMSLLAITFVTPANAQQTGTLLGPRVVASGETGGYQVATLPPGTYSVKYELAGFTPLRREEIIVQVARTTRLDVVLTVGALQETVTVSGESPVVDVSTTVTQTNQSRGYVCRRAQLPEHRGLPVSSRPRAEARHLV